MPLWMQLHTRRCALTSKDTAMAFPYFPHTEDDVRQMLDRIGVGSLKDLYSDVPQDFIYRQEYALPDAMSEHEVRQYFEDLAEQNVPLF